jgi:hypothetical protein
MDVQTLDASAVVTPPRSAGGFRWLVCASIGAERGAAWTIPRWLFPDLAAALVGRPARWVWRDGDLHHPPSGADPDDLRYRAGCIVAAWARPWAVLCVVQLDGDAGRLHQALLAMHRARGRSMGLSLHATVEKAWPRQDSAHFIVTGITRVLGLDFVTRPADRDARVLRPLGPHEFQTPPADDAPEPSFVPLTGGHR